MAGTAIYIAEMDDGSEHKVAVDQRDLARVEREDLPEGALYTRARFLVWSAMSRQKLTSASWAEFNELQCAEVRVEREAEDDDGDPKAGRKAATTASTSR